MIALGNSRDDGVRSAVFAGLDDVSPLVRAMAVWALSRHCEPAAFAVARSARYEAEADADVRREWDEVSP